MDPISLDLFLWIIYQRSLGSLVLRLHVWIADNNDSVALKADLVIVLFSRPVVSRSTIVFLTLYSTKVHPILPTLSNSAIVSIEAFWTRIDRSFSKRWSLDVTTLLTLDKKHIFSQMVINANTMHERGYSQSAWMALLSNKSYALES